MNQSDALIIDMVVGDKANISKPQLQAAEFVKPQLKANIGQSLKGHGRFAKVMSRRHPGCTTYHGTSTHRQHNIMNHDENKKGSKLGVKHNWPPPVEI